MNIYFFDLINGLAGKNPFLDRIMIFLAKYLIFLAPLFLFYLLIKKDKESKKSFLFILSSLVLSFIISWLFRSFYFHPRPFMIGLGKELISHKAETSFPSNNTLLLASISLSLLFLRKYKSGIFFFLMAFLVGISRVFCGVHFPLDIIGSFFIAFIGGGIVFVFKDKFDRLFSRIIKATSK